MLKINPYGCFLRGNILTLLPTEKRGQKKGLFGPF